MLPWESEDMSLYFLPWLAEFTAKGPIAPLAGHFSNYTPPFLYLMALASRLVGLLPPVVALKLISVAGNLFLSFGVYAVVRLFRDGPLAFRAALVTLLLPTVALNGPFWGQCDGIYTGALLIAVAAALRDRPLAMMAAFGVAISFKLQAVFLGPFLVHEFLRQRLSLWLLLVPPAVYVAFMIPASIAGRPAMELLALYPGQASRDAVLAANVSNPWLAARKLGLGYEVGAPIAIAMGAVAAVALIAGALRSRLDRRGSLLLALGSAAILPFVLPNMHDRYFFVADVLSLVLAVCAPSPRTIVTAILIQAGSLGAYLNYLFDVSGGAMVGMLFMAAGVAMVVLQIFEIYRVRRVPGEG